MIRTSVEIFIIFAVAFAVVAAAEQSASKAKLSAAQIDDKNVEARGGLQAWRAGQTIALTGKLGAGRNQRGTVAVPMRDPKSIAKVVPPRPVEVAQLPFLIELERPRKMRFELQFNGQTALQVYDGANGMEAAAIPTVATSSPIQQRKSRLLPCRRTLTAPWWTTRPGAPAWSWRVWKRLRGPTLPPVLPGFHSSRLEPRPSFFLGQIDVTRIFHVLAFQVQGDVASAASLSEAINKRHSATWAVIHRWAFSGHANIAAL